MHDVIMESAWCKGIEFYSCNQMSFVSTFSLLEKPKRPPRKISLKRIEGESTTHFMICHRKIVGFKFTHPSGIHHNQHVNADGEGFENIHGLTFSSTITGLCLWFLLYCSRFCLQRTKAILLSSAVVTTPH